MSTRNPASWTTFNDESKVLSRQRIITTVPTAVANDQVFCLDAPQMFLSSSFVPWDTDDTGGYRQVGIYVANTKRMCDVLPAATTVNCKWAVYAWAGDAAITEFKVKLGNGTTDSEQTINASLTTKKWRGFSSSVAWGAETHASFTLSAYVTGTGGVGKYIYIAGLMAYSEET
jgi:endonuclease YncB( thermonuclease family)